MGFDPSIELVRQRGQNNFYRMAVGDTKYETGKVLYDIGADYLAWSSSPYLRSEKSRGPRG